MAYNVITSVSPYKMFSSHIGDNQYFSEARMQVHRLVLLRQEL